MLTLVKYSGKAVLAGTMLALAIATDASAQRVTYEQAWAICKKEVVDMYPNDAGYSTGGRYARMMSCMNRYGYSITQKIS
jgi:hypothetical protein